MKPIPPLSPPERLVVEMIACARPFDGSAARPLPAVPPAAWPALLDRAEWHGVAPLLYSAVKESGSLEALPAPVRSRLRLAATRTGYVNALVMEELGRLLDRLKGESVPVVVLKGAALAVTLYPQRGLRPLADIDLLVRKSDVPLVRQLLAREGYERAAEMGEGFQQDFGYEDTYLRGRPNVSQVDVHWHLLESAYFRGRVPIEWFWERTEGVTIDGRRAPVLCPDAALLYLAAHLVLHHHGDRLIWVYDLALLLARDASEMDWEAIVAAATRFGLAQPLLVAFDLVESAWGIGPPSPVLDKLARAPLHWQDRVALAAVEAPHSDARFLLDAAAAPSLAAALMYCARLVFPSTAYMRERYGLSGERWLPLYYLWRPVQLLFKLARSVLSLLIGRETETRRV